MTYTLTTDPNFVVRDSDATMIPANDPTQADSRAYGGWLASGNKPNPAPIVAQVPMSISRGQFFEQCAIEGVLSADDAVAAAAGTITSSLATLIAGLPASLQLKARIKLVSATDFERANEIVIAMGVGFSWDGAKLDQVWTDAKDL